jgi:hypothetical protein
MKAVKMMEKLESEIFDVTRIRFHKSLKIYENSWIRLFRSHQAAAMKIAAPRSEQVNALACFVHSELSRLPCVLWTVDHFVSTQSKDFACDLTQTLIFKISSILAATNFACGAQRVTISRDFAVSMVRSFCEL